MDLYVEGGEGAGVLAADDPSTDHGQRPGHDLQPEDGVGAIDPRVVVREERRALRRRPGGDQDDVAPQADGRRAVGNYLHDMGVDEGRLAPVELDLVAGEVGLDPPALDVDDLALPVEEVLHR